MVHVKCNPATAITMLSTVFTSRSFVRAFSSSFGSGGGLFQNIIHTSQIPSFNPSLSYSPFICNSRINKCYYANENQIRWHTKSTTALAANLRKILETIDSEIIDDYEVILEEEVIEDVKHSTSTNDTSVINAEAIDNDINNARQNEEEFPCSDSTGI